MEILVVVACLWLFWNVVIPGIALICQVIRFAPLGYGMYKSVQQNKRERAAALEPESEAHKWARRARSEGKL